MSARPADDTDSVLLDGGPITYRMVLPDAASDYIQGHLAGSGQPYEKDMLADMAARLTSKDLVLDVGANIGNHTIFLAAVVGCSVVAYEPNPRLTEPLLRSVQLNQLGELVRVRTVAVGDRATRGAFVAEMPANLGGQSVAVAEDGPLEVVRLDDEMLPGVPTALKIDVEGMELAVLAGAERLIEQYRPVLYVECRERADFLAVDRWATARQYLLCDEFNATPTFRFEPTERLSELERTDRVIARSIRERYDALDRLTATRTMLDEANGKYRAAAVAHEAMRARLAQVEQTLQLAEHERDSLRDLLDAALAARDELAPLRDQQQAWIDERATLTERVSELDAQASEARARAAELMQEVVRQAREQRAELHDRLSEVVRTVSALRAELATSARQAARVTEEAELRSRLLRAERDQLASALATARAEAEEHRARLRDVRSSLTFRTGREFRRASSSVGAALKLPVTLARLAREARHEGRRSVEVAAPVPLLAPLPVAVAHAPARRGPVPAVAASRRRPGERLRVAAIMDEFTRLSFAPEWDLTDLTPHGWAEEIAACDPDLLFVESAWRGRDGQWKNMVAYAGEELRGIIEWCRERGVPTVFWNKEDPVHYATFLNAALLFDHVFTTDMDRIEHYKAALGHDRVWLLPFAAQPAKDNPLEDSERKDAFMFAGAYYRRYPERTRDLETFVEHLPQLRPVEIYDRNLGGTDEAYLFPEAYRPLIVGGLAPQDMARAYKGYRYAVNLNSVKQSQTMLARRIFELLASNTVTVSNFARSARVLFGDLVITTDSGAEAVRRLRDLRDHGHEDRLRLAALRTVMAHHTYADRASYVRSRVTGEPWRAWGPRVHVIAVVSDATQVRRVVAGLERQQYPAWTATLLVDGDVPGLAVNDPRIAVGAVPEAPATLGAVAGDATLLAGFGAEDYYGPHYLLDLALGTRYSTADVLGKECFYRWEDGEPGRPELVPGAEYGVSGPLGVRRSLARSGAVATLSTAEWVALLRDDGRYDLPAQVALDRFGYCAGASDGEAAAEVVDDRAPSGGMSMTDLLLRAEAIGPAPEEVTAAGTLGPVDLAALFSGSTRRGLGLDSTVTGLRVTSVLADDTHDYLYARTPTPVDAAWVATGTVHVDTGPGLDLQLALVFLAADGTRLGSTVVRSHTNMSVAVPAGTAQVKFGLRVRGAGSGELRSVAWAHRSTEPAEVVARADTLVLTNIYPADDDLYRNGFVHSRVRAYRAAGVDAEVFCLRDGAAITYREFEGVDVTTGSQRALSRILRDGSHDRVLVHFLDPGMWAALQQRAAGTRVVVWIHGAEVQPWWRRSYNIDTDDQLEAEKARSEQRLAFWRSVFSDPGEGVHFVFVSRYFAEEVMEDVGVRLSPDQYSIVHNPVDVDLFGHHPKPADQRFQVLSIRPFASRKYANDLSVEAVRLLAHEPEFTSMTFRFIGAGPLFDETLAPIRDLPQVHVEQRFLSQREIADMHREHGIFLVPTRMDAQGVSRDEAMASGLVPISNAVAAVPEFVDDESGILVPEDDAEALAAGILALVRDPERFVRMSAAAAARVRRQSAARLVIAAELRLMEIPGRGPGTR